MREQLFNWKLLLGFFVMFWTVKMIGRGRVEANFGV